MPHVGMKQALAGEGHRGGGVHTKGGAKDEKGVEKRKKRQKKRYSNRKRDLDGATMVRMGSLRESGPAWASMDTSPSG